jgi:hypothetical protein
MEAIGFISLWGFTPSIDFFQGTGHGLGEKSDTHVLLSECADIRHLLRTLADNLPLKQDKEGTLHVYIHEKQKENLCRDLLLLTLICERQLSMRER